MTRWLKSRRMVRVWDAIRDAAASRKRTGFDDGGETVVVYSVSRCLDKIACLINSQHHYFPSLSGFFVHMNSVPALHQLM